MTGIDGVNLKKELLILEYLSFRDAGIPIRHSFNSSSERWWEKCLNLLDSAGMIFHFIAKLRKEEISKHCLS